jgi:hypothetical protein
MYIFLIILWEPHFKHLPKNWSYVSGQMQKAVLEEVPSSASQLQTAECIKFKEGWFKEPT